jgi:hypothetical protein
MLQKPRAFMLKWCIIFFALSFFQCHSQNKDTTHKSKFPSELDYFRKSVPDSLKNLLPLLDSVLDDDQRYRDNKNLEIYSNHKQEVRILDSINLIKIAPIIERYGILGVREIGFKGNAAIFMTLQHASLKTHIKYLPAVEEAFKKKNILPSQYAMFVDRTALGTGKMQIYGTQVAMTAKGTGELEPVADLDSLDDRRRGIGMTESIEQYLNRFGIKWDIDQYKKDLPSLKRKYKID